MRGECGVANAVVGSGEENQRRRVLEAREREGWHCRSNGQVETVWESCGNEGGCGRIQVEIMSKPNGRESHGNGEMGTAEAAV